MYAIYKYAIDENLRAELPDGSQVLCVAVQGLTLQVWARVIVDRNGKLPAEAFNYPTVIRGFPTGAIVPDHARYISTVQQKGGALVWHFFTV